MNFWATWCTPCRLEAPSLQRLYMTLRADGFEVLGISIDRPQAGEAVGRFKRDFSLDFPIPLDPTKAVYDSYEASGVPETYLVDRGRKAARTLRGPSELGRPALCS